MPPQSCEPSAKLFQPHRHRLENGPTISICRVIVALEIICVNHKASPKESVQSCNCNSNDNLSQTLNTSQKHLVSLKSRHQHHFTDKESQQLSFKEPQIPNSYFSNNITQASFFNWLSQLENPTTKDQSFLKRYLFNTHFNL